MTAWQTHENKSFSACPIQGWTFGITAWRVTAWQTMLLVLRSKKSLQSVESWDWCDIAGGNWLIFLIPQNGKMEVLKEALSRINSIFSSQSLQSFFVDHVIYSLQPLWQLFICLTLARYYPLDYPPTRPAHHATELQNSLEWTWAGHEKSWEHRSEFGNMQSEVACCCCKLPL